MVLVMEDNMMVMLDVEEVLSVEATTVRSSEHTSTKRMTAVKNLLHLPPVLVVFNYHLKITKGRLRDHLTFPRDPLLVIL